MMLMNNLFSPFDPSNYSIQLNWLMLMIPALMINKNKKISKQSSLKAKMMLTVMSEMKEILSKSTVKENVKISVTVFVVMAYLNVWSLIPSSFTMTAQISMNIPVALTLWLSSTAFNSILKTKKTLSHLLPTGTPPILMPLMVIIELTSNLIRPITLAVRLTANMVAGHILISLTEKFMTSGQNEYILSTPIMMVLLILEMGVAMIQAFIFSVLITLFSSENH